MIHNFFINYLSKIFPSKTAFFYILNTNTNISEYIIEISSQELLNCILFLKKHTLCQFKILSVLTATDLFTKKSARFQLIYDLLSVKYNIWLRIKLYTNDLFPVMSISSLYKSANWAEREIWDLFGIIFKQHPDLWRILTDYGFNGHPLWKDFPLTGFLEVFYNEKKKRIKYIPIELSQEFWVFNFKSKIF